MMPNHGFSHVGVSTHAMDDTIAFYEGLLGFSRVVESVTSTSGGGTIREVYFDLGEGQFIVFMEPKGVPGIGDDYDTGINGALGLPRGMYHFALKVASMSDLESRRGTLANHGVEVSAIIDLGHARSIFCFDPNGIQLEFCWQTRRFDESDLHRVAEATLAPPS